MAGVPLSEHARSRRYPKGRPRRQASALCAAVFASQRLGPGEPSRSGWADFAVAFDDEAYQLELEGQGLAFLAAGEHDYPTSLRSLTPPLPGLFLRGRRELLSRPRVVVCGLRDSSRWGDEQAEELSAAVAAAGVVVVSGLARGSDAAAHAGALEAGSTLAVLGCGIDRDYPALNAELAAEIAARGLIVSEYAPGVAPAPWRFAERDRVLLALAQAVVVIESRPGSASRALAEQASALGRPLFALSPGPGSRGDGLPPGARPWRDVPDLLAVLARA